MMPQTQHQETLPEYVTSSVGHPDFQSIANRLRGIAALLAAQGMDAAAEFATRAYGALLGEMAARASQSALKKSAPAA